TAAMPMRTPVNEPGPCETAQASISCIPSPVSPNRPSTILSSVWEWVNPASTVVSATMRSPSQIHAEAPRAVLSIPKIFKPFAPLHCDAPRIIVDAFEPDPDRALWQFLLDILAPLDRQHRLLLEI